MDQSSPRTGVASESAVERDQRIISARKKVRAAGADRSMRLQR